MGAAVNDGPRYFATARAFGAWLAKHHGKSDELIVGFWKKDSGKPSMTWPESVDEALCVGWIDGVRRSLGDEAYTIRFTPRRPGSNWSLANVRTAEELIREGLMAPAGLAAYEARRADRTGVYSFERRRPARLDRKQEQRFRADDAAWTFFQAQPPSYRRAAVHWVVSAKREETRARRLDTLIADSAAGRRIAPLTRAR